MPEEVFIIVVVAILAGTFTSVVKIVIGYLQSRRGDAAEKGSLTESQLRRMIEESVDASMQQLERRFDTIETRLNRLIEAPAERRRLSSPNDDPVERELP